jgi:hypothetical protein
MAIVNQERIWSVAVGAAVVVFMVPALSAPLSPH